MLAEQAVPLELRQWVGKNLSYLMWKLGGPYWFLILLFEYELAFYPNSRGWSDHTMRFR